MRPVAAATDVKIADHDERQASAMAVEPWEAVLAGVGALLLLMFFVPGVREQLKNSPRGTAEDWKGLLLPIGLVVLFVVLLVALVS